MILFVLLASLVPSSSAAEIWLPVVEGNRIARCEASSQSPEEFAKSAGVRCMPEFVSIYSVYALACNGRITQKEYTLTEKDCEYYRAKFNARQDPMFAKDAPRADEKFVVFDSCFEHRKKQEGGDPAATTCKCVSEKVISKYPKKDVASLTEGSLGKLIEEFGATCAKPKS